MKINKIRFKRNGVMLLFENAEPLLLNKDIFNKSGLSVGSELETEDSDELLKISTITDAKTKALQLLARRSHSIYELSLKLVKRNFDKNIINLIISQLVSDNYLDDRKFALLFAEEKLYKQRNSLNKVKADLIKRGISKAICEDIISKYQDDEIILNNIKFLAEKKYIFLKQKYSDSDVIKNKVLEYLFRKGFDIEQSRKVLDSII